MKRSAALVVLGLALVVSAAPVASQARDYVGKPPHHQSKHSHTNAQARQSQAAIAPQKALDLIKAGNQRFIAGKRLHRDYESQVRGASVGRRPLATVLGYTDSQAVPEIVFDLGIGDLFAPRIAGNDVNDDVVGSLEFATKAAGSRLIVVLGQTEAQKVADHDVKLTVDQIKLRSPVLRDLSEKGEVLIVGALYDISTGKVDFFD